MLLNSAQIGSRQKQILAGLFLSKFDDKGLAALGFDSFTEAFNALGYALGGRPASIKNYRDEFDPLFPNPRQGWRKRHRRDYCLKIEEEYRALSLDAFAMLVSDFVGSGEAPAYTQEESSESFSPSSFAQRLITGRAAEQYFQATRPTIEEFAQCEVEDTTAQGCGYDFRLWPKSGEEFKAIEVKGMAKQTGWLSLTEKEYGSASALEGRFYLFVVKNFRERPFHEMHVNPLAGPLSFVRRERAVIQVSWSAAA